MALRQELVELYFDYIHDQFHSIFHRATFVEDMINEKVPAVVLFAVFALSARFSTNDTFGDTDPRERGEIFRVASETLLRVRDLTTTTVQACVLLGAHAAATGETEVENLYYSMAGRMCLALDLPNFPGTSPVERETNIRIWWTICMVDIWSSTAVKLPRIMPPSIVVPLPVDELTFATLGLDVSQGLGEESNVLAAPLLAEMIKLNKILSRIIDFNQVHVSDLSKARCWRVACAN
jgi:hypothetical protein